MHFSPSQNGVLLFNSSHVLQIPFSSQVYGHAATQSFPSQKRPLSSSSLHFLQTRSEVAFGAVSGQAGTHLPATESQNEPPSASVQGLQICVSGAQIGAAGLISAQVLQTLSSRISGHARTHYFASTSQKSPPSVATEHCLHDLLSLSKIGVSSGQYTHLESKT